MAPGFEIGTWLSEIVSNRLGIVAFKLKDINGLLNDLVNGSFLNGRGENVQKVAGLGLLHSVLGIIGGVLRLEHRALDAADLLLGIAKRCVRGGRIIDALEEILRLLL